MSTRVNSVWLIVLVAVFVAGCGDGATQESPTAPMDQTTTTAPAETTTTTTAVATTTTAAPTTTTTTGPAFNLDDLDETAYNSTNYTCGWATDAPPLPNGQLWSINWEIFALEVLTGEAIEPFVEAVADIDIQAADPEEVKPLLADVCREIGAPTDEYYAQFSG